MLSGESKLALAALVSLSLAADVPCPEHVTTAQACGTTPDDVPTSWAHYSPSQSSGGDPLVVLLDVSSHVNPSAEEIEILRSDRHLYLVWPPGNEFGYPSNICKKTSRVDFMRLVRCVPKSTVRQSQLTAENRVQTVAAILRDLGVDSFELIGITLGSGTAAALSEISAGATSVVGIHPRFGVWVSIDDGAINLAQRLTPNHPVVAALLEGAGRPPRVRRAASWI
ncbi:MAG: hypothetical protein ACI9K2_006438 [Myxococcota bacterium]